MPTAARIALQAARGREAGRGGRLITTAVCAFRADLLVTAAFHAIGAMPSTAVLVAATMAV